MFKFLGKLDSKNNEYYQKKLSNLFNSKDGKLVLSWIMREHVFNEKAMPNCDGLQYSYYRGKLDFIKYLVRLSDFDYNVFEDR